MVIQEDIYMIIYGIQFKKKHSNLPSRLRFLYHSSLTTVTAQQTVIILTPTTTHWKHRTKAEDIYVL